MCYDISSSHRSDKDEAQLKIDALKKSNPDDYFNLPEFRKLQETIRQADWHIRNYERSIKMGVKY